MTKLHGCETLFHGTAVVYTSARIDRPDNGCNRFVEEIPSILLILVMLLYVRCSSSRIMSAPGLELIVGIPERPIYPPKLPRRTVHSFA